MNSMVFGRYLPVDSFVHRLDPRLKIGALLALLITVFFDAGFIGYAIIGAFVILALVMTKIPAKMVVQAIKPMLIMLLFLSVFNLIFLHTGKLLVKLGPLSIYSGAVSQTVYISIRLVLIVSLTTILTASTKPLDMTLGLEHLLGPLKVIKFPVHEVAMMISIALRFIPTLVEEAQRIMKAQASRGVDFNEGTFKEKVFAIVSLIIPLFISAFQKADDLANAMESRNYNPEAKRTRYHQLHWRVADTMTLGVITLLCGAIIAMSIVL